MRRAAGIGAPDVVKATCPVRGALGGNPLSRGSMDAVLRLHGLSSCSPAPLFCIIPPFTVHSARRARTVASRPASTTAPGGYTDEEPHREQGQAYGHTCEEQRHHRSPYPLDAMPTRRPSFRLLAMASPYWMLVSSY